MIYPMDLPVYILSAYTSSGEVTRCWCKLQLLMTVNACKLALMDLGSSPLAECHLSFAENGTYPVVSGLPTC